MFRLTPVFLVAVLGFLLAARADGHPCDAVSEVGRLVCDPDVPGRFYFCVSPVQRPAFSCQSGLVFKNDIQACDYASAYYDCPAFSPSNSAPTTTTTSPAPTTSSTPATTSTPSPATSAASSPAATSAGDSAASTSPPTSSAPGSSLVGGDASHPCDAVTGTAMVCNPATGGESFYWCLADGTIYETLCPPGLVFSNENQVCDRRGNGYVCDGPSGGSGSSSTSGGGGGGGATTPRSTTTTTTASAPEGTCNEENCVLPDCLCVGTSVPRLPGQNLTVAQVPQMVMLTFDDDVNSNNFGYYDNLFPANETSARKNPNGCRTGATFFVSDSWTNMTMVKMLADRGSELASHSRDHSWPTGWSARDWADQMQGMREKLAKKTGVPTSKIVGMRAPFLELGGEEQFAMLTSKGFLYDSTMFGGVDRTAHPLWPFTLAYPPKRSGKICDQKRCPSGSYPKIWEVPLIRQYKDESSSNACSMTDAGCIDGSASKDDVFNFLLYNFNRHYTTNRAPFMISLHATWFSNVRNSFAGLEKFLDYASAKDDVWQVTLAQMLDWVRNPTPLQSLLGNVDLQSWQC